MIAEIVVGTWVALFAWLMGRSGVRRFRGNPRLGYLGEAERPSAKPSIALLLDTADPSAKPAHDVYRIPELPVPTSIPGPGTKESR